MVYAHVQDDDDEPAVPQPKFPKLGKVPSVEEPVAEATFKLPSFGVKKTEPIVHDDDEDEDMEDESEWSYEDESEWETESDEV